MSIFTRLVLLLLPLVESLGCAATLQDSGKGVATGAIHGTAEAAEDPATKKAIANFATDARVQQAVGLLSAEVAGGIVDGLTEESRVADVERLVARSVARSLSAALGPETERRMEALSAAAARGAFRGMSEAMNESSLQGATPTIGSIAREVGKEATLGFQDAVHVAAKEEEARPEEADGEVLVAVGETADTVLQGAPWLFWVLVVLLIGALSLSGLLLLQRRRDRTRARALHPS